MLWTLLWLSSDLFVVVGFGFVMVIVKVYSYLFFYCSEYDDGFVYFYCYLILVMDIYMDIVMFTFYIYILSSNLRLFVCMSDHNSGTP